ncbi:MAG: zinc metallopeptidase [Thiohalomonadales bacterium]
MHIIILLILIVLVIYGPQVWAQAIFKRYSKKQERIPGTGGELAIHLLKQYKINNVTVEKTDKGDHYDPADKVVRLSENNYSDNSLTAIAVAAHEVGHAVQDFKNEAKLATRTKLIRIAQSAQQLGVMIMIALPILTIFSRSPAIAIITLVLGLSSMGVATLVHLVTLPVEIDASFGKALPMLKAGNYISKKDEAAVKRILRAAAYTYVAASLASLLNLGRWIAMLRR